MKIFTATKEKRGKRKNDFNFCKEGEFVKFHMECDGETIDGHCGCKRSMSGFKTLKSTTTIKVADVKITKKEYIKQLKDSDKRAGWYRFRDHPDKAITDEAEYLLELANSFKAGIILERRGNNLRERK